MLGQSGQASCGPAAVSNAVKALGIHADEADVLKWMDRCRSQQDPGAVGAGVDLIARACADCKYKLRVRKLVTTDRDYAVLALRGVLLDGSVAVLHVDDDEDGGHWVAAVGLLGRRFLIADAADREIVLSYGEDQLLGRWVANDGAIFALLLGRKR